MAVSMQHFKTKKFNTEARKADLKDNVLIETLNDFLKLGRDEQLKFALGAGLYKLRIATKEGRGKSGGSRSILAYKKDNGVYWLHLFSKNEKGNVTTSELRKLKQLADIMLVLSDEQITRLISLGELCEVNTNV
ncbi:type II toxin-antitoxin system RelE/ParE family toxin [Legionella fairfieldensis]|uniref:type II toxin-antitoxin system RelE/ParE family toxin n=1 Tax=Legionella fairfieldensis TaxID=45064 RepID=UPI001040F5E2|nr:type II toxin-antitoxin system RelE/ParE family toxin [Legionella fairfieldensis]